ncbi:MAG: SRPBCC family protein [bacterium]|nr:SRPBCC family protein [bacterium]
MASLIEKGIEVEAPVRVAYDQWTQFEDFPRFMEGVLSVEQLDDRRLRWTADVGAGNTREWTAEITEQLPDRRIAWRSLEGARNRGVVTFHHVAPDRCRVMLQLEYEPEGLMENVGDVLGVMSARVSGDLERFKRFIEDRGTETGGWRGTIGRPAPSPEAHAADRGAARCMTCGNTYEDAFTVTLGGRSYVFDSFECALHRLAPSCAHCGCRILGHGVSADGALFCCAHCARRSGNDEVRDSA